MKVKGYKLSEKQWQIYNAALSDEFQYIVIASGRQVGKTEVSGHILLKWLFSLLSKKIGYIMPTYKQCKKIFRQIKEKIGVIKSVNFNMSDMLITYKNTSIQFLSAESGDTIRGFTFWGLIIDEACFIHSDVFYSNILPTVMVNIDNNNGKLVLLSTPKSKNWFYNYVYNPPPKSFVTRFTSYEGGLISKEQLDRQKSQIPEHIFKNEFLGEFLENGNGIFKYKNAISDKTHKYDPKLQYTAGLDWGNSNDYTVLTIVDNNYNVVLIKKWRQIDWSVLIKEISTTLRQWGQPTVYAETNGIGNMPTKELQKSYPRTIPFNTSNKSKIDIIHNLSVLFEDEKIKIPNDESLILELDNYEMKILAGGGITYNARQGFHDDMIMSLAFACQKQNTKPIWM